jgi:hypothetical protein
MSNTTTDKIQAFRKVFLNKLVHAVTSNLIPNANKRFRRYVRSERTQDQPINANFQSLVHEATTSTLREMDIEYWVSVTDHRSDTHIETDEFILQLDAKGCLDNDRDFEFYEWNKKNQLGFSGIQIHLGIAQHTRTFTHILNKARSELVPLENPVVGKQLREIDGKPVFTMVSFLKWSFSEEEGYFATSVGIAEFPHENHVYAIAGKQKDTELRFVITNPDLYSVHRFASESAPQIQDSTPSDNTEHQVAELPTP